MTWENIEENKLSENSFLRSVNSLSQHFSSQLVLKPLDRWNCKSFFSIIEKKLKQKVLRAIFDQKVTEKHRLQSFMWKLLEEGWSVETVLESYCFKIILSQRKFVEAKKIKELFNSLPKDNELVKNLLYILLCLSNKKSSKRNSSILSNPSRSERLHFENINGYNIYGDLNFNSSSMFYKVYPDWVFDMRLNSTDLMIDNDEQSLIEQKSYEDFSPSFILTTSSRGLDSKIFENEDFLDDFSNKSRTTLYGGLVHTHTGSFNSKLSLPKISELNGLDLCKHLIKGKSDDIDEGFVSGENNSLNSSMNEVHDSSGYSSAYGLQFQDNQPYPGYKYPLYDLSIWSDAVNILDRNHRTWENIGLPPSITVQKWYLTECTCEVYDQIWKEKLQVDIQLSNFFNKTDLINNWKQFSEDLLIQHAGLVSVGISSESFHLDQNKRVFVANKSIYTSGITPLSVSGLLSTFANWGTCFWRLLEMISTEPLISTYDNDRCAKGVIFKALCERVRIYLHSYQRVVLARMSASSTLNQFLSSMESFGNQLRYVATLCKLVSPCASSISSDLPLGVALLNYLYDETTICSDQQHYYLLLFILRGCFQPYLQFIQAWVFRGYCHQMENEFMLKKNSDEEYKRNRQRWTHCFELSKAFIPAFLAPLVDDIFITGKTMELLQIICPNHFLCKNLTEVPEISITFTRDDNVQLQARWIQFQSVVSKLGEKHSKQWLDVELKKKKNREIELKKKLMLYEEEKKIFKDSRDKIFREIDAKKRREFEMLKSQAADAQKRKIEKEIKEKEEDKKYIQSLSTLNSNLNAENIQKLKKELVEEYDELKEKSRLRELKANWKIKRLALNEKRQIFLESLRHSEVEEVKKITSQKTEVKKLTAEKSEPKAETQKMEVKVDNNYHNSHASDSVLQNLIYYQKDQLVENVKEKSTKMEEGDVDLKKMEEVIKMSVTRNVAGKHVSQNTVSQLLDENEKGEPKAETQKMEVKVDNNYHNSHASDSVLQNLIYYQKDQLVENVKEKSTKMEEGDVDLKKVEEVSKMSVTRNVAGKHVSQNTVSQLLDENDPLHMNQSKADQYIMSKAVGGNKPDLMRSRHIRSQSSHPSYSIIQDIINFRPSIPKIDINSLEKSKDHPILELPDHTIYEDFALSLSNRLSKSKKSINEMEVIDLCSNLFSSTSSQSSSSLINNENEINAINLHSLPILLRSCVLQPIRSHAKIVNRCAVNYFMNDLQLLRHFETLRKFLLLEDGEFSQVLSDGLFEMIHSGENPEEVFSPVSLDSLLVLAVQYSTKSTLFFTSNLSLQASGPFQSTFNEKDLDVLKCLKFKYNVSWPCNIILTDSCHAKYNQIFLFLLQLKHVAWALHDIRSKLHDIETNCFVHNHCSKRELRFLHIYRREMHNFVSVMQGYVSTQVLYVCWKEFIDNLSNKVKNLEDLHIQHEEYLNKCLAKCLLQKADKVMKIIKTILQNILLFRTQLSTPHPSVFKPLNMIFIKFKDNSNLLFKIVSKFVQRGYQPHHLEDFLIRLNFNEYYKT